MRRTLAMPASIALLTGCTAFHRVPPSEAIAPGQTVRVTFESPRDLEARRDTTVYPLPAIKTVYGRVEAVRSDTLVLRVLELASNRRQPQLPREARLVLPRDAFAEVSTHRVSTQRTAGLMFLLTIAALAVGSFVGGDLGS